MNYAHSVQLTIQNDLISKLGKTSLVDALIELIWNALDADALNVRVIFEGNGLDSLNSIKIIDDGVGIHFSEAKNIFKNLGGSKKKNKLKSDMYGRFLHGKEGKGRLKAFSLGATVNWTITYQDENLDKLFTYKVAMHLSNPSDVKISDPIESDKNSKTGVILEAYDVPKQIKNLNETAKNKILETFAFYLYDYKNINLEINGEKLDPKKIILDVVVFNLDFINYEGKNYPSNLKITEWISSKHATSTYLSCNHGIPYLKLDMGWSYPNKKYTAYIESEAIIEMVNMHGLDFAPLNPSVQNNLGLAKEKIKKYFRDQEAEKAATLVEQWKEENIYPYSSETTNIVEQVERQVFNIVASTVSHNIDKFEKTSKENRKFQFRLLKQALETNPNSLQTIINEVLNLKPEEQDDLAELLRDVSLSSIISASKVVTDRLKSINGLENIINSKEGKKNLKERTQLHRILAENCWVFGEEFFISVDDQSLTECLKQHSKLLSEDVDILEAVEHPTKERGIVDLMLSKTTRNNKPNTAHHLIIELKRPNVKIGRDEIAQIQDYADAIRLDSRFSKTKAKWTFIAISLDRDMKLDSRYIDIENGIIAQKDDYIILVKTWAEIFDECKAKLQFFQESLKYKAKAIDGIEHLQKHFPKYVEGVISTIQ